MAVAYNARGSGSNTTSATSFTFSPASNCTAGAILQLNVGADNASTSGADFSTFSISDDAGNTWERKVTAFKTQSNAANDGFCGGVWITNQSAGALTTSSVITVSFGSVSVAVKVWILTEWTGAAYSSSGVGTAVRSSVPTVTTSSLSVDTMLAAIAWVELGSNYFVTFDSDTTGGTWTNNVESTTGTTAAGQKVIQQTKLITSPGTQSFDPSFTGSSEAQAGWISYIPYDGVPVLRSTVLRSGCIIAY